jgi:hypothetical protein
VLTPGEGTDEAVEKGVARYSPGRNSSIGRARHRQGIEKGESEARASETDERWVGFFSL